MRLSLDLPSLPRPDFSLFGRAMWRLEGIMEEVKAQDQAGLGTRQRIRLVLIVVCLVYGVLAAGAIRAALFNPDARAGAYAEQPAEARADLVDRNGQLLATDLLNYGLFIDPRQIWDFNEARTGLDRLLPADADRIAKALNGDRRVRVVGGITPALRDRIEALGLPGVSFEDEAARLYPLGSTAAHLIGFTDAGGDQGLAGAEGAFNSRLTGAAGPLVLSIDLRVQAALDEELGKAYDQFHPLGAVGLVIDTQTGEVLGMSNYPTYDPNKPASADQRQNRAANALYEMGSTFKAFTIAAGLDTGVITPASTFDATHPIKIGYRTIHDMRGDKGGIMSTVDVFTNSSNIGAAEISERIGQDRLHSYLDNLGLTQRAPIELAESARPLLPKVWNEDAMLSASFGHGLKVTPIALAQAYSGIINDGIEVPLTVLKRTGPPPAGKRVVSEKTSQTMLEIMRANVLRGTGKSAGVPGIAVGGKTGTGEKVVVGPDGKARYDDYKEVSSFAAAFPTTGGPAQKRYFVLVLMDEPNGAVRTGATVAAPAVGKVIDRIAPFLGVARQDLSNEVVLGANGVTGAPAPTDGDGSEDDGAGDAGQ